MTFIQDSAGRKILEGTVYVGIVFDLDGKIVTHVSFEKADSVAEWAVAMERFYHTMRLDRTVVTTLASYREMM